MERLQGHLISNLDPIQPVARDGDPGPVGKCHCTKCRKVSGTGSNATLWIRPDKFTWLAGEDNAKKFYLSDGWRSIFCGDCGSPLPALIEDRMWVVPAGLLDGNPELGVRGHIWVENKPHWEIIGDDAPTFSRTPSD